ncbi:hypothetical protein EIB93_003299 [Escherichia coli]|nr:hypothetical protein [Escherichia coli]
MNPLPPYLKRDTVPTPTVAHYQKGKPLPSWLSLGSSNMMHSLNDNT